MCNYCNKPNLRIYFPKVVVQLFIAQIYDNHMILCQFSEKNVLHPFLFVIFLPLNGYHLANERSASFYELKIVIGIYFEPT